MGAARQKGCRAYSRFCADAKGAYCRCGCHNYDPGTRAIEGDVMKKQIGAIVWGTHPRYGHLYDYIMFGVISLSVLAMSIQTLPDISNELMRGLSLSNTVVVAIFTIEYLVRIWTTDKPLRYIFSFWGLVDLVAFLPYWLSIGTGTHVVRLLRLLRLIKLLRYMTAIDRVRRVAELVWKELLIFLSFAALMLVITAVGIYNFENAAQPDVFKSIPHSLWFAVTTLTTVGYGDAYPTTAGGKFFTFIILMIGLGVVALPAGLISAAFMQAREEHERERRESQADREKLDETQQ
jgi:voltage-gated potassium channel